MSDFNSSEQFNQGLGNIKQGAGAVGNASHYAAKKLAKKGTAEASKAAAKATGNATKAAAGNAVSALTGLLGTSGLIILGLVILVMIFLILLYSIYPPSLWFKDANYSRNKDTGKISSITLDLEQENTRMLKAIIPQYANVIIAKDSGNDYYSSFAQKLKYYLEKNYGYALNSPPPSASELGVREIRKETNINGLEFIQDNTSDSGFKNKKLNLNWKPRITIDNYRMKNPEDGTIDTYFCRHYSVVVTISPSPQEIKEYINAYALAVNAVIDEYSEGILNEYDAIMSGNHQLELPSGPVLKYTGESELSYELTDEGNNLLQDSLKKYEKDTDYVTKLAKKDTSFFLDENSERWKIDSDDGKLNFFIKKCAEQVKVIDHYEVNPVTGRETAVYVWDYLDQEYPAYEGQINVMMFYNCEDYRKAELQSVINYVSNTDEPKFAELEPEEYINKKIENYFYNILGGTDKDLRRKYYSPLVDEDEGLPSIPFYGIPKSYFTND